MLNRQQLKNIVSDDFSNSHLALSEFDSVVERLSLEIIQVLPPRCAPGKTYSVRKTQQLFQKYSQGDHLVLDASREQILAALNYLSTSKVSLFKPTWFLIGDEYPLELDETDLESVFFSNEVTNPETGELVQNAKDRVYLSFTRVANLD
jgi:hypothetical protein